MLARCGRGSVTVTVLDWYWFCSERSCSMVFANWFKSRQGVFIS